MKAFAQPETFVKPKTRQEIVNVSSFPRRRKSWLNLNNRLFLQSFLNIKQNSCLRWNDGRHYFQAASGSFAKVSTWNQWHVGGSPTYWQTSHTLFNQPFSTKPLPRHFSFQAASVFSQRFRQGFRLLLSPSPFRLPPSRTPIRLFSRPAVCRTNPHNPALQCK